VYLFNESYVVKEPESRLEFRWHIDADEQLSALVGVASAQPKYYSAWCPLDKVTRENGTIAFQEGTILHRYSFDEDHPTLHFKSEEVLKPTMVLIDNRDFDGSTSTSTSDSDSQGCCHIEICPGSVLLFSSTVEHCSGENCTDAPRRVFYAQYSPTVIGTCISKGENNMESAGVQTGASIQNPKKILSSPLNFAVKCDPFDIRIELHDEAEQSKSTETMQEPNKRQCESDGKDMDGTPKSHRSQPQDSERIGDAQASKKSRKE
jgi:ectoine hydroxylase-related dioxygenase (phytanoyl-CoA dioxygenase family)